MVLYQIESFEELRAVGRKIFIDGSMHPGAPETLHPVQPGYFDG